MVRYIFYKLPFYEWLILLGFVDCCNIYLPDDDDTELTSGFEKDAL